MISDLHANDQISSLVEPKLYGDSVSKLNAVTRVGTELDHGGDHCRDDCFGRVLMLRQWTRDTREPWIDQEANCWAPAWLDWDEWWSRVLGGYWNQGHVIRLLQNGRSESVGKNVDDSKTEESRE